jgi:hypothetical protein
MSSVACVLRSEIHRRPRQKLVHLRHGAQDAQARLEVRAEAEDGPVDRMIEAA